MAGDQAGDGIMTSKQKAVVGLTVLSLASLGGWLVLRGDGGAPGLVASGTVEAREADLGFQLAGRVATIAVREGDVVAAEDELAWLDRLELDARQAAAAAQVEAAAAQLAELEGGTRSEEVAQARAAVRGAERRLADAQRELDRSRRLFEGGAISRQALDAADSGVELAGTQHEQAREQLRMLERGARPERIGAQRALLGQARAAESQVMATLANAVVRAPFDGVVTVRHREPGETVAAGAPVVTLMDPGERWVRIYVRQDRIGEVRLGQPATIRSDTYPERAYGGEVIFISNRAEFTPRNVQTAEERTRLVYAVRVRITGDPAVDLKPGIAADVRLDTTRR
jgi:HlyD family secretion protein